MNPTADTIEKRPEGPSWSTRLAWFGVNLALGVAPTLLFFAWVEQDASLPWVAGRLGWPWVDPGIEGEIGRCLWDAGLFVLFGLVHSSLAQVGVQARIRKVVPASAIRSFFLAATGTALLLMLGLWQSTGRVIWRPPVELPGWAEQAIAEMTFAASAVVILALVARLGFFEFLGWAQLFGPASACERTAGTPELRTSGIYGCVRHPVYTGLLAMFVLGPTLSMDRLILFLASIAYLSVGIPVEERKLIRLFGPAYVDYRRRVPALLPDDGSGLVVALGRLGESLRAEADARSDRVATSVKH
jgi:protein-S-isoprenylcysteine O-methyltransferase Ste14